MLILTLVLLAVVGVLLLWSIGNLFLKLEGLAAQIANDAEENLLQHRVTRSYVGGDLIEKRVLPSVGYREPRRTPFEEKILTDFIASQTEQ
jgi:hypothetical protein